MGAPQEHNTTQAINIAQKETPSLQDPYTEGEKRLMDVFGHSTPFQRTQKVEALFALCSTSQGSTSDYREFWSSVEIDYERAIALEYETPTDGYIDLLSSVRMFEFDYPMPPQMQLVISDEELPNVHEGVKLSIDTKPPTLLGGFIPDFDGGQYTVTTGGCGYMSREGHFKPLTGVKWGESVRQVLEDAFGLEAAKQHPERDAKDAIKSINSLEK